MVAKSKKPHIGYSILLNNLQYAYYGTVKTQARAEELKKKFEAEGQWTHLHQLPGDQGINIFHRDGTFDHPKQPFGARRPDKKISFEQATREREQKLNQPKKSFQKEPGERGEIRPGPRITLTEQEKRDKKKARRAARRARIKAAKESQ